MKSKVKSRDGPRLKWNNYDMAVMEAVSSGKVTITAASREFNVPRKTLDDRVKGRVAHGKKPGISTVLTTQEEESLEKYCIYMAERGFPLTRTMVKAFGWAISKRSGRNNWFNPDCSPSDHRWQLFKKRHPILVLSGVCMLKLSTPKL